MIYKVFTTPRFDERLEQLSPSELKRLEKLYPALAKNPYQGKALGFKFLREKKIKGIRVYFLIYDDYVCVLLVSLSDKKTQKEEIKEIKKNRELYLAYAKKMNEQLEYSS